MLRRFDSHPPSKAAEAEAEHEGGDHDRDRLDVDTEDAKQGALPGELIDQRRKPGEEEQYAQDARPLGKALATVGTVYRQQGRGSSWADCSWNEWAILGRKYYGTLNKECRIAERPKKNLAGFG